MSCSGASALRAAIAAVILSGLFLSPVHADEELDALVAAYRNGDAAATEKLADHAGDPDLPPDLAHIPPARILAIAASRGSWSAYQRLKSYAAKGDVLSKRSLAVLKLRGTKYITEDPGTAVYELEELGKKDPRAYLDLAVAADGGSIPGKGAKEACGYYVHAATQGVIEAYMPVVGCLEEGWIDQRARGDLLGAMQARAAGDVSARIVLAQLIGMGDLGQLGFYDLPAIYRAIFNSPGLEVKAIYARAARWLSEFLRQSDPRAAAQFRLWAINYGDRLSRDLALKEAAHSKQLPPVLQELFRMYETGGLPVKAQPSFEALSAAYFFRLEPIRCAMPAHDAPPSECENEYLEAQVVRYNAVADVAAAANILPKARPALFALVDTARKRLDTVVRRFTARKAAAQDK